MGKKERQSGFINQPNWLVVHSSVCPWLVGGLEGGVLRRSAAAEAHPQELVGRGEKQTVQVPKGTSTFGNNKTLVTTSKAPVTTSETLVTY